MTSLLVSLALAAAPVPKERSEAEFLRTVDDARGKAVRFLKEKQDADGGWESHAPTLSSFKSGVSALVALSLLEAGVPADDPAVAKAVEYLLAQTPDKTYAVSLHMQVLARADAKKWAKQIQAHADWLMDKAIMQDKKLRGWSYPGGGVGDNSNTLFAITGLHAAAQAGAKVDPEIWPKIRDYYAATQKKDGGWTYHSDLEMGTTQSMTLNGLLGLAVATKYDKQAKRQDPAFDQGMDLILSGRLGELGQGKSPYTMTMVIAELGRALGSNEFRAGKVAKAWYRDGAEKLLKEQQFDGSWKAGQAGLDGKVPLITTACGLYFLGPPAKK